jgi:hypothetical protein
MMSQECLSVEWDNTTTEFPDSEWIAFRESHSAWTRAQSVGGGPLHCLHPDHVDQAVRLFRIDREFEIAERDFAALCDWHDSIGISADRFLRYPLLRPQLPWPPKHDLKKFLSLGWTQSDIAVVNNMSDPTRKINSRLRSAAGRLICMPSFLTDRDALRQRWDELSPTVRPLLPIAKTSRISPSARPLLVEAPRPLIDFALEFDEFCDKWQLLGMTTWDLPSVRGPQWAPALTPDKVVIQGGTCLSTPWHFPVLCEDGLGPLLEMEHRQRIAELGIDDEAAWETYARLFEVFYWENVLSGRYERSRRKSGFVTAMQSLIAAILGLSSERVQRLRKRMKALRSGRLKSLSGLR